MKARFNRLNIGLTCAVVLGFYYLVYYRSALVESIITNIQDCGGCYQSWVLLSDSWLALLFALLIALGLWLPWYLVRVLARMAAVGLLCLYVTDLLLFENLTARLFYYDILNYFDAEVIKEWWLNETGVLSVVVLLLGLFGFGLFIFKHKTANTDRGVVVLLLLPALVMGYLITSNKPIKYVHDIYIRNFISINLSTGEAVEYSQAYQQQARQKIADYEQLQCQAGLQQKPNIIMVVLESFSFYQSELLSGIHDWTPNVDRLSKAYKYHDNFFANNFNSLAGRLALLTGEKTFREIAPYLLTMRRGYYNTQRNLPDVLQQNGYHTSFIDAADLGFTNTGDYMNSLGFDFVEGNEGAFYEGHPRYAFGAVADEVLYARVIDYVEQAEQPFFSMVITVTTHHPYINPVSGKPNLEQAVKYADQAVYKFYQDLKDKGFFDDGLLILTSDHRSMTPLFEQEIALLGEQALAKVPLVFIGKDYEGLGVDSVFSQQSDMLNSLQYLVSSEHCYRTGEGNLFAAPPLPAECVYHSRGDYRDRVDVYCDAGSSYGQVKLNGDETALISGSIPNANQLIDFINVSRMAISHRHETYTQKD